MEEGLGEERKVLDKQEQGDPRAGWNGCPGFGSQQVGPASVVAVPGHPKGWRGFSDLQADGDKGQNSKSKSVQQPARLSKPHAALVFGADLSFGAILHTQFSTLSADIAFLDRDKRQKEQG